jgi:hypothetical protein
MTTNWAAPSDVVFCGKDSHGYSSYKRLSDEVDTAMVREELKHEPMAKELIDLGMIYDAD